MESGTTVDGSSNTGYTYHGQSTKYIAIPIILIIIATISVSLRCWTQARIVGRFSASEFVLIAAVASGLCSLITWLVARSQESNYAPESDELFENLSWMLVVSHTLYMLTSTLTKSYAALYLLPTCQIPWQRWIYVGGGACLFLFNMSVITISLSRCGDINTVTLQRSENCAINFDVVGALLTSSTLLTVATEWLFASVPLYIMSRTGRGKFYDFFMGSTLNMGTNVFAMGGMVISLVRIKFIPGLKPGPRVFETFPDAYILGSIESSMCIVSLSLCALHPLYNRLRRWNDSRVKRKEVKARIVTALQGEKVDSSSQDSPTASTNESNRTPSPVLRRDSRFDDKPPKPIKCGFIPSTIESSTHSIDLELDPTDLSPPPARPSFYSVMPRIGILPDTLTTTDSNDDEENLGFVGPDARNIIWRWGATTKSGTLQSISESGNE